MILLLACAQDVKTPEPPPEAPKAEAPVAEAPKAEPPPPEAPPPLPAPLEGATVLDLDEAGGGSGAPKGTNAILPPSVQAEVFTGELAPGASGARLSVRSKGDALICTADLPFLGKGDFRVRLRLVEIEPGPADWNGMTVEMRARDKAGALVPAPSMRYTPLKNLREKGGWIDLEAPVTQVDGAATGQFCFRFVESTGVVEIDRVEFTGKGK